MITIDKESRQRKRLPIELDFMTQKFKTENGLFTFPSPSLWTIEKNLFYLLRNSKVVQFDKKYKMKPSYLSYDEYKTVVLGNLLMRVNSIQCIEDFDLDTVVIPTLQSIVNITRDKIPKENVDEMTSINW